MKLSKLLLLAIPMTLFACSDDMQIEEAGEDTMTSEQAVTQSRSCYVQRTYKIPVGWKNGKRVYIDGNRPYEATANGVSDFAAQRDAEGIADNDFRRYGNHAGRGWTPTTAKKLCCPVGKLDIKYNRCKN